MLTESSPLPHAFAAPEDVKLAVQLPRWLPAQPLIDALDSHCQSRSLRSLVCSSGIDRRTFERVRHRQRIRSDCADRVAVALGRHPSEIWPEWFAGVSP